MKILIMARNGSNTEFYGYILQNNIHIPAIFRREWVLHNEDLLKIRGIVIIHKISGKTMIRDEYQFDTEIMKKSEWLDRVGTCYYYNGSTIINEGVEDRPKIIMGKQKKGSTTRVGA